MFTLLPDRFVLQEVTKQDYLIASIAFGFTLGFGFLTTWTAIKQSLQIQRRHGVSRLNSPYVWMIWLEIFVCLSFSIICWLYVTGTIPPSFAFYFCILTLWALQVQFLLQIIINRVAILLGDRDMAMYLKAAVAVLITLVNISVYCIWVPARLQISERYVHINEVWDRCEKGIYLVVDGMLNFFFIYTVKKRLVQQGLNKYEPLVKFNIYIIGFSLSMDVLIIGMMSLNNTFVYMQFHPLAYIVKLKIEMSMADLIVKVAREPLVKSISFTTSQTQSGTGQGMLSLNDNDLETPKSRCSRFPFNETDVDKDGYEWYGNGMDNGLTKNDSAMEMRNIHNSRDQQVHSKREVSVTLEKFKRENDGDESFGSSQIDINASPKAPGKEEDTRPLRPSVGGSSSQNGYTTKAWTPD